MKKYLSLILAVLLALSALLVLGSCSGTKDPSDSDNTSDSVEASDSMETSDTDETSDVKETSDTDETSNSDETSSSDEEQKFVRGTVSGNVYTNAFADMTFTKPDGWVYYTDAEIAELLGVTEDTLLKEDVIESAALSSLIDCMAVDPTTGNNMNIAFENLAVSNSADMSVDDYIEVAQALVESQLEGLEVEFGDVSDATLGSLKCKKVAGTVSMSGVEMKQNYYYAKIGKYMAVITVTIVDTATTNAAVEAMFS